MAREIRPVPPVLAGAEEEHLDTRLAAFAVRREYISLRECARIDTLMKLDMAHRPDAVSQPRRPLEIERLRRAGHFSRQQALHRAALAVKEQLCLAHQL